MNKSLHLLWAGESSSVLGTSIASVCLPLVAIDMLHAGPLAMGVLEAAIWLPWLLIGLPAGAWVDQWSRRRVMLVCDFVALLAFSAVPVANWAGVLSVPLMAGVAFIIGSTSVFFSIAYRAFVPSVVAKTDLHAANARLQGSESAAAIAGPSLGGTIAQAAGPMLGLVVNAASFLVSAACLCGIKAVEPPAAPRPPAAIKTGLAVLFGDPYLRAIAIYSAFINAALAGGGTLQILFLVRDLHASGITVGVLLALEGVGGVIGAWLSSPLQRRFGSSRALLICALALFPTGLMMPFASPGAGLAFFAVAATVPAAAVVALNVIVTTFRQSYCPPRLIGRVTAGGRVVGYVIVPLSAVGAGALATDVGIRPTLIVVFAIGAAAGAILLIGPFRQHRNLPQSELRAKPTSLNNRGFRLGR